MTINYQTNQDKKKSILQDLQDLPIYIVPQY